MKTNTRSPASLLYEIQKSEPLIGNYGLLRAVAKCLSVEEALAILIKEASRASELRDAVLHRIAQDSVLTASSQLTELVAALVAQLQDADARGRQGLSFCLSTLFPILAPGAQHTTLGALLTARSIVLRRRAYRLWERQEVLGTSDLLAVWGRTRDPECAWLLVKLLPAAELVELREDLLSLLSESWQVSRLYLRIAEVRDDLLSELGARDGISYCYVLAKLGRSLSDSQARKVISRHELDDRLGLLVWALGKMKLEPTLRWLVRELPKIEERKLASLQARNDALLLAPSNG